ncbi:MAG: 50S ribosomal protein L5 [Blastochloris sp.]|nr:50S ribosomal protein L5 [Blastochloris sp.]
MSSSVTSLKQEYLEKVVPALKTARGYKNVNQVPKISKVVVNCCIASAQDVKNALEDAINDITIITGQKPVRTISKQSISNFKLREGQEIGCKVTLRGRVMYEFLLRLTRMALPRIRDFRGISTRAFDGRGAYTLGIKDHTIFPEIELDKIKRNLGMDVTIVTTAKTKEETKELLSLMGMPFADRKVA